MNNFAVILFDQMGNVAITSQELQNGRVDLLPDYCELHCWEKFGIDLPDGATAHVGSNIEGFEEGDTYVVGIVDDLNGQKLPENVLVVEHEEMQEILEGDRWQSPLAAFVIREVIYEALCIDC